MVKQPLSLPTLLTTCHKCIAVGTRILLHMKLKDPLILKKIDEKYQPMKIKSSKRIVQDQYPKSENDNDAN
jgi:hypothetical protein